MRESLTALLDLPAGTVVSLDDAKTAFHFAWQSLRGLHITHSEISTVGFCPSDCSARIRAAAVEFNFVIARQVLDEKVAALGN
jgi:hypothetical protein